MLGKKYFRLWKEKAWSLSLLRKAKKRRKKFASWMGQLPENSWNRTSRYGVPGLGSNHGNLEAITVIRAPSQPLDKRNSLPVGCLQEPAINTGSSTEITFASETSNAKRDRPRHNNVPHKRSKISSRMTSSGFSSSSASSNLHGITQEQEQAHPTDYFRLKALGLDPDTPAVPLTSKKRPRAQQSSESEKRFKPLLVRQGANSSSHSNSEQSGQHHNTHVLQQNELALQDEDDSDEALFVRSRRLRETMSESISWLQSERSSHGGAGALVDETPTKKKLKLPWPTLSRTEQRRSRLATQSMGG